MYWYACWPFSNVFGRAYSFLVTATMAVDYINSLDIGTLSDEFRRKAKVAGTAFADDGGAGSNDAAGADSGAVADAKLAQHTGDASAELGGERKRSDDGESTAEDGRRSLLSALAASTRSPRAMRSTSSSARDLAPPIAPDGATVIRVNLSRVHLSAFFDTFGYFFVQTS